MGDPVDSLFSDRDAFADFFTRYYTDWEPENCRVAEADGEVVGYVIACTHYNRYLLVQLFVLGPIITMKVLWRLVTGRYSRSDIRFLTWFVTRAGRETPRNPKQSAHFHFNFLPGWRDGKITRRLVLGFLDALPSLGVKRIYGGIQTFDDRRPARLFERYGFRLFDRRKVTKFERFGKEAVYVSTFYREFA